MLLCNKKVPTACRDCLKIKTKTFTERTKDMDQLKELQMLTTISFVTLVEEMRASQKLYFTTIGKARKTRLPEDFKEAEIILKRSKELEEAVDRSVTIIKSETTSLHLRQL